MSKLLRTVSFASANFKALALAIVLVICGANTSFAQNPSLVCPADGDVNCLGDIPAASISGLEGSGFEVSVVYSDAVISGTACDQSISRSWVATFTSPEFEYTETCSSIFRVADFEAPVFVDAPGNASYQCIGEVPAYGSLNATDACGGDVVVQQFGSSSSMDDTLVCNQVTTPQGPGQDWGLWINGLVNAGLASTDWYRWNGSPSLVFSANGEARLIGDVVAMNNPANGWHVDVTLNNGKNWAQWNALGRTYMDNLGTNASTHVGWNYYELLTTISHLEGFGAFAGSQLIMSHQPSNYYYGFQFGNGANNRNGNNGGSGWFFYEGHVGRRAVSGHGDITLEMGCDNPNHPNEFCLQTITRRWTATDGCGNVAHHDQTISVEDTTAPVFSNCPASLEFQCAADAPAMVEASSLVATDNCGEPVTITLISSDTTGSLPCEYTITNTYQASDVCNNRALCSYSISVHDTQAPVLVVPTSYMVECNADVFLESASASDNCTASLSIAESVDTTHNGCEIIYTRSFYVADDCGNVTEGSQTISVIDVTAPVLVVPAGYIVECNTDVYFEAASATDNCTEDLSIVESVDTAYNGCYIIYNRYFSVMDDCGNAAEGSQTIEVIDTTSPILEVPADYSVQCNDEVAFESASATDNCTQDLTIIESVDTINNGIDCRYTYIRTFVVADNCGNTAMASQTIEVEDTIAPEFENVAGPYYVECDAIYDTQWVNPAASDNCDNELTYSYEDNMTSGGCLGTIHRTVVITDNCGNSNSVEFVIYIQDTTAPTFVSIPVDATVECSSLPGAPSTSDVVAADNCGGESASYGSYTEGHNAEITIAVSTDTIAGSCEGSYTILWIWTATDYCENVGSDTTTITVVDTTIPEFISVPQALNYDCSQTIPGAEIVMATDNCTSTPIEAVASDFMVPGNCPQSYTIERTYVATDDCGNEASYVQYIYITDMLNPIFDAENEQYYYYECGTAIPAITPTVSDNCDEELTLSFQDSEEGEPCHRVITRTWSAADDCGNMSTFAQTIYVNDTQAPVIDYDVEITALCSDYSSISGVNGVSDNCSTDLQVAILSDEFVSGACAGRIIRLLTATDDCGNADTVQQFIILIDTVAPVGSQPLTIDVECINEIQPYTPTWSDNCASDLTYDMSEQTTGIGCDLVIIETYSATDPCGNVGYTTRTINVVDTTGPILQNVPADVTVECSEDLPSGEGVTATDNCDAVVDIVFADVSSPGNCAQNYTIERTFRAYDDCGNETVATQIINVVDRTAPVFSTDNQASFEFSCDEVPAGSTADVVNPTADDNCGLVTLTYDESETGTACNRIITRDWTAADECGNLSHFIQTITVVDEEAPVISGPVNVQAACDNYGGNFNVSASDNCSASITLEVVLETITGTGCNRVVNRTYRATDSCNNSSEFTQFIQLYDNVAPTVSNAPVAVTRDCNQPIPSYTPQWSDNCDNSLTTDMVETAYTIGCTTVITRAYTATDDCGNQTTVNYVITLVDTTAPVADFVAADYSIECSEFSGVVSIPDATFHDNCAGAPVVTESYTESMLGCDHVITISWTATDACGNQTTVSTQVTVYDHTSPVFTFVPAGGTFSCEQGIDFGGEAEADDNCNIVTISHSDNTIQGNCENAYTIVRTWTATDECGNYSNAQSEYVVVDQTAPYFTSVPANMEVACDAQIPATVASASDACDTDVTVTYQDNLISENSTCSHVYERVYTAVDNCGNSITASHLITVIDNVAPVFDNVPTITLSCDEVTEDGIYVNAIDNCGTVGIDVLYTEPQINGCGTYTRHYGAYDNCGNSSYYEQTIVIVDYVAPVASVEPVDFTVECGQVWLAAEVTFTDNCSGVLNETNNVVINGNSCSMTYTYIWTATDACGNSTTVDQVITVEDTTAPSIDDQNTEETVACGSTLSYSVPTATDVCSAVEVTAAYDTTGGNCPSNYTVVITFTATDVCGNYSSVTHTIHYLDEVAPVWSSNNETTFTYECSSTAPMVQPVATDNCSSISYNYFDGTPVSNGCTSSFTRTWIATDGCGNSSVSFVQTMNAIDTTEPVLSGCPSDVVLPCTADVPAPADVTVTDNCDSDIDVVFSETCIGCTAGGAPAGSNLTTPVRPVANTCLYPYNWAMALFSLPSQYRWYQLDTTVPATMIDNGDGTLTLSGRVFNVVNPNAGFDFSVTYANGQDWATWSTTGIHGFKADCGGVAANHTDWMYYIMQSSASTELIGWGDFDGTQLQLTHAPSNQYFGLQVGQGANNYNSANGAGGWFLYSGQLLVNGQPVNSGLTAGIGDFAFEVDQCPTYSIVRSWTAIDCAGNESTCSQTITFSSQANSFAGMGEINEGSEDARDGNIAIVGIMPNPANDRSQISFMSTTDGNLSLQVLDMTGRVVGNLFNKDVDAGMVYTADFDANSLSTGVYMVRLSSGTAFEIERLMIEK